MRPDTQLAADTLLRAGQGVLDRQHAVRACTACRRQAAGGTSSWRYRESGRHTYLDVQFHAQLLVVLVAVELDHAALFPKLL
eukprot:363891-Chlamydomonas_euryale.AAC.10